MHTDAVTVLKKCPMFEQVFATGSKDGTVVIWKFYNGIENRDQCLNILKTPEKLKEFESLYPILTPTVDQDCIIE